MEDSRTKAALFFCGAATFLSISAAMNLSQSVQFYQEDGLIENLTACLYLFGAVNGAFHYVRQRQKSWLLLIVATLSAVAFLDEMSFGERHFGVSPIMTENHKIDGVHDLMTPLMELTSGWLSGWVALAVVCALFVCFAVITGAAVRSGLLTSVDASLLVISCALIGIAQLVDVDAAVFESALFEHLQIEEISELTASAMICLLICGGLAGRAGERHP